MMNETTVPTNDRASGSDGPGEPEVSTLGTLIGVFAKPKATFQALSARPRILAAILVLLVSQLVFGLVLAHSGILRNDTVAKLEAKNAPPEQIEAVSRVMEGPTKYAFVIGGPVVLMFSLLVTAGLLYFIANLMLGARLRFIHYLCIAAYGGVVGIVDQMVRMGIALGRGTLLVNLGVGAFMGEELSRLMHVADTATDPLLLWATAIEALGVSVMARKSFGFGVIAVLPGFLLLVSLSAFQQ
jgi:hypothetical protein